MKKTLIFTFGLFLTMVGVMSCGDGGAAEAKAKALKDSLYNDSIMKVQAAVEQARMDSMALIAAADSARAQAVLDSIAEAEASKGVKGGTKPKPKTTPAPAPATTPTPAPVKPLTGKDAVKGTTTTPSGKDAVKGTSTTAPSGKDAIKNGGK